MRLTGYCGLNVFLKESMVRTLILSVAMLGGGLQQEVLCHKTALVHKVRPLSLEWINSPENGMDRLSKQVKPLVVSLPHSITVSPFFLPHLCQLKMFYLLILAVHMCWYVGALGCADV